MPPIRRCRRLQPIGTRRPLAAVAAVVPGTGTRRPLAAVAAVAPGTGFLAPAILPGTGEFRPLAILARVPEPGKPIPASELPECQICRPPRPCSDECHGVRGCLHCCLVNGGCKHAAAALDAVPDPDQLLTCVICLERTHAPWTFVNAATGDRESTSYCESCIERVLSTSTQSPTTRGKVEPDAVRRLSMNEVCALLAADAPPAP